MPDPVDIYARLRFQQGTVAADARAAMEAARKEFSQGINVPLRFQQQGGGGTGGGGAGAVNTAAVTQAATAAAKAATPATAAVITQAATTAATKAAQAAAGGAGAGGVSPVTPAAQGAAQSLNQLTQGIRAVTRIAAVAEGVAAVGELGIHGGRLASALAGGKNLTAAREVEAMQQTVRAIPLIGNIADRIGNTVYDLISSAKNFAGGGRFESDQSYAARLAEEQKFQDKISQLRAQRARAFLPGPQAAVQAAEDQRSEFAQSKEAQLLKEENPDLYKRVYEEIGRTINVVKKKAAIEDEHDTFQHQQTLTRINDQAEIARMNASGNRLGAERKQVGERYDYETAAAEQAAKELREVNRDQEAEEQDQRAAALRGLKVAELEEANARNRMIGFTSGTALWQRMMEAAARYIQVAKESGTTSEDTGNKVKDAGDKGAKALDSTTAAAEKAKKAIADLKEETRGFKDLYEEDLPPGGFPRPPIPRSPLPRPGPAPAPLAPPQVTSPGGGVVGGMDLGGDTATSVALGSTAEQNLNTIIGRQGTDISPEAMNSESGLLVAAKRLDQLAADAMRSKNYKAATTFRLQAATLRNKLRIMRTQRTGRVPGETRRGALLGDIAPGVRAMLPGLGGIPVYGPGDRYDPRSEEYQAEARDTYQQAEMQEMPIGFRAKKLAELKQAESTSRFERMPTPEERAASQEEAGAAGERGAAMGSGYFQPPTNITSANVHSFGRNIDLADGSFDKFKRAMKEAMRETGAQFELIK